MDPNTALTRIRELLRNLDDLDELDINTHLVLCEISELIDHIHGLDEWLSRGGFLPAGWQSTPQSTPTPTGR